MRLLLSSHRDSNADLEVVYFLFSMTSKWMHSPESNRPSPITRSSPRKVYDTFINSIAVGDASLKGGRCYKLEKLHVLAGEECTDPLSSPREMELFTINFLMML
jgi:hypothetical protein